MAKLKDDEIKWILSLDATQTQQEIHKVTQANKELAKTNKDLAKDMRALEAQGKKNSDEWNNLKASYDENAKAISLNTQKVKEHEKTLGYDKMTMSQLKKTASELQKQLDHTSKSLHPEAYAKLEKEIQDVAKAKTMLKGKSAELSSVLSLIPGSAGSALSSIQMLGTGLKALLLNPVFLTITAIVGLIAGLFSLTKNSMEFSKALSNLSAITGATGKDLDFLKEKAKMLGKEYGKSAVEIVEAMKLVGSAKPELLSNVEALSDVTASVLTLSKATGLDLSESTKSVTTIMNQFGLSALESDRTINVLAAGSKYGAVEVDYLGESISKVGTVAKSAGLTLEQTTAVMELFGEKGVRAETAGNGFKKVLVELQSDTKNYTNGVFDLNKAIDNNQKIGNDNIALQKKFGTEFFGLAQILIQNRDRFNELTTQVTGTTVAEEQMAIATDNLSGDVDKMSASWDAFMLSLEDGKGPIATTFRTLVQWATDAVDALGMLTKSSSQKEADLIADNANLRIKSLKEEMSGVKNKVQVIDSAITAEQRIYQRNNEKIKKLKKELEENDKKNFFMHSTNLEAANKREIESLQKSVNRSIAFVNAAAGLRASIASENKKINDEDLNNDKELSKEQKKLLDDELEARKRILEDNSKLLKIEEQNHNGRLKTANIFGKEQIKLTKEELAEKLRLEELYIKNVQEILTKSENERYERSKKQAGISSDKSPEQSGLTGDKLKAYEILYAEHKANLSEIEIQSGLKQIDIKKQIDSTILKQIQESGAANQKVIDTVEKSKISKLKSDLLYGLATQEEYEAELKQIESDSLAERLTAQEKYIAMLKNIANPTEEQKKELENAESVLTGIQTQIYDKKLAEEKSFQDKRKAVIQKYGLETLSETHALAMAELEKEHKEDILNEEKYEQAKLKLKIKAAQDYASQVQGIVSAGSQLVQSLQSAETSNVQADYAKRLSNLNQSDADYAAKKEQLQYEQAVAELDVQKKYANAQFGIQAAQIGVATATGVMNAWASSMVLGPVAGPIAAGVMTALLVATGVAQIAAANSERQKLLASTIESPSSGGGSAAVSGAVVSKSGYADGGYTGDGGKYDVAGYLPNGQPFHRGEYFVAQEEMRNPILIPLIRKIDNERSRRTGSTSLPGSFGSGYADGGYSGSGSASAESILMARTVEEFRAAVNYFAGIKFKAEINYWEWVDAQKTIEESQNLAKRAS